MQECAIFNPQMQGTNNVSIGCGYKCRWRAVYEEQRDIYARLKACITRQRISFRLFKQWYWESFDKDVQVSPYFGPPLPAQAPVELLHCVCFSARLQTFSSFLYALIVIFYVCRTLCGTCTQQRRMP